MRGLTAARRETTSVTAELRIRKALASKIPRNCDLVLKPGDKVRVFRETDKKYTGPFPALRQDGKQVFVLDGKKDVQYSIAQVIQVDRFDAIVQGDDVIEALHSQLAQFRSNRVKGLSIRRRDRFQDKPVPLRIFLTEILHPKDSRC